MRRAREGGASRVVRGSAVEFAWESETSDTAVGGRQAVIPALPLTSATRLGILSALALEEVKFPFSLVSHILVQPC